MNKNLAKIGKIASCTGKIVAWTVVGILALVILVVGLLYVPLVQDWIFPVALEKVSEMTQMDIKAQNVRLHFPLILTVKDVQIVEHKKDTMLTAGEVHAGVELMPLLHGEIIADRVHALKVNYNMGNLDSAMCLRAEVDKAVLKGTLVGLKDNKISLSRGEVEGANIDIVMKDTVIPPTPPNPNPTEWFITANDLHFKDIKYSMVMQPTIDTLGCALKEARLTHAIIDMRQKKITGTSIEIGGVDALFLSGPGKPTQEVDTVALTDTSPPWLIEIEKIRLQAHKAKYTTWAPKNQGMEFAFSDLTLSVDSFLNQGANIRVPLRRLSGYWDQGMELALGGLFEMDSTEMRASDFFVNTARSALDFTAAMSAGDLAQDPYLPFRLMARGNLASEDVRTVLAAFSPGMLRTMVNAVGKNLPSLDFNIDIDGCMADLNIYDFNVNVNPWLTLKAQGAVENINDFNKMEGHLALDGKLKRPLSSPLLKMLMLPPTLSIPVMTLTGDVDYAPGLISGDLKAVTGKGKLAASGSFKQKKEGYEASIDLDHFPVDAFMPSLGIKTVTASLEAEGEGFNFLSPKTHTSLNLDLGEIIYKGERLGNILADITLKDREATLMFDSSNPHLDVELDGNCKVLTSRSGQYDSIDFNIDMKVHELSLHALQLVKEKNQGSFNLLTQGWVKVPRNPKRKLQAGATVNLHDLAWQMDTLEIVTPQIDATVLANDTTTHLKIENGDFDVSLLSSMPWFKIMDRVPKVMPELDRQMKQWSFNAAKLQEVLPPVDLNVNMGWNNVVSEFMEKHVDMRFNKLTFNLRNDSLITLESAVDALTFGTTLLDSVSLSMKQQGEFLRYFARIDNNPGTMDEWAHVRLSGYLSPERVAASLRQENIQGEKGFALGFYVAVQDSVATLKFQPHNPTIAYKKWKLNADNFISYNLQTHRFQADLALENEKSYLKLFTRERVALPDSLMAADEKVMQNPDEVVLQLSKIHLQDWLSVSPFAPPIKGDLNGDMAFFWDGKDINGNGTVGLKDLYYGREKVGNFDLGVDLKTNTRGVLTADLSLMVDSVKTITARGAINDSTATSPFLLDFSMVHFPLHVANPFLPPGTAKLSGMLNGSMEVTGDPKHPMFNGYLDFDTAGVKVNMLGTTFLFSEEKIPVENNVVKFNDFGIKGCNKNPLTVNGYVDIDKIANVKMDMKFAASNFQIVNSNRPRGADVYGKGYLDLDATVKGDMQRLNVNAFLSLLEGSNITYIVPDATAAMTSRSNADMVHFVQFNDTAQVEDADTIASPGMALNLDATLAIRPQTTITVDLSADGKNRAQIEGAGTLEFDMSPLNGERMTGKFNILGGYVRYSPPFMSEKRFDFQEGSFISFNGNMLNPTLNVTAIDRLKANVTQKGQNSRLVNFDIILSVTGTLETMKVAFNLNTDDDITVQNELQSMSPEQRANQAMNMLLYNVYSGAGTTGNANMAGNPLYAFLESTVNTWMANNVRGVDISFGIDQYDKTYEGASTTATSYSYQVSKTLFDDRFKIVVGGNYSTDANADENFSQNLINDISFEYMLNRTGSMYIKLFRHTGYVSILEGEVTQTGVGFVIKRSLNTLKDLFRFGTRKEGGR